MNKAIYKIFGLVLIVLFVALSIVSKVKGGCTGMIECTSAQVPMKCHWTFIAMIFVGIAGALTAALAFVATTCEGRRMASLAAALQALLAIVITSPLGIGTCAHADSPCNGTAAIVYVLAVLAIIIALVMAAKAQPEAEQKPKMQL